MPPPLLTSPAMGRNRFFLLMAVLPLAGCAHDAPACSAGLAAATRYELFFGRNVGQREAVSDEEWRAFAGEEIAPRFPDGFTVIDTSGQWRDANGMIVMERGKEVIVIAVDGDGGADAGAKIESLRDVYKRRFKQDSVLEVATPACAGF